MDNLVLIRVASDLDGDLRDAHLVEIRQETTHRHRLRFERDDRALSVIVSLQPELPWIGRPAMRWEGPRKSPSEFTTIASKRLRGYALRSVRKPGSDRTVRLALYRRAASIIRSSEIDSLRAEFKDRFGPMPETVKNLLVQLKLKLLAEKAGLESIFVQYGKITLGYPEGKALPQPWEFDLKVRFGDSSVWLPVTPQQEDWIEKLSAVLEGLLAY